MKFPSSNAPKWNTLSSKLLNEVLFLIYFDQASLFKFIFLDLKYFQAWIAPNN